MQYRHLGDSGLKVSAISVGTWQNVSAATDIKAYRKLIQNAFERGINFFDTADNYAEGNAEKLLGEALKPLPRQDYVVSTKCFFPQSSSPTNRGLSRKHIVESVDQSLKRLQLDHIDILLCHRFDSETPLAETASAMESLIRQGKILYWGVSRWDSAQLQQAKDSAADGYKPILVQSNYNMLNRREAPVIEYCAKQNIGFVAYSPLAQGVLSEKYLAGIPKDSRAADHDRRKGMYDFTPENIERAKRYAEIAKELKVPLSVLALAWALHTPGITSVLCGISNAAQLEENAQASELAFTAETLKKIHSIHGNAHA